MTTYQEQFQKAVSAKVIPDFWLGYFREAFRESINEQLLDLIDSEGSTRAAIARKIGRRPEQLTRWINSPSNLELDTVSDLALAFGCEPKVSLTKISFEPNEDEDDLSSAMQGKVISIDDWLAVRQSSDAESFQFEVEAANG